MQVIDFESGVWAVISLSGGKKVIGSIQERELGTFDGQGGIANILKQVEGEGLLTIDPCFGLHEAIIPIQTQGGTGMQALRQCVPLDNCMGPSVLHARADGVHFFADMTKDDCERHKSLVQQLMQQLMVARAEAAGISIATPEDVPRGPRIS